MTDAELTHTVLICCWCGGTEHIGQNPIGQNHRRVSISTTGPSASEELLTYSSELISDWCRTNTHSLICCWCGGTEHIGQNPIGQNHRRVSISTTGPSASEELLTYSSELISDWCRTNTHSLICCWWGGTEHIGQNPIGQNHRRVSISTTGPSSSEELLTYSSELISDWCRTNTHSLICCWWGGTEHIGQNPIGQNHRRVSISTTGPSASEELLTYSSELISDWCRTNTHSLICCWCGGTEHIGQNPIGQNHRRVSISTTGPSASEELLTYSSELISDWCRTKTHSLICCWCGGTEHIGQNPIGQNHRRVSISTTGPSASEELLTYSSELISDWCRTNTHSLICCWCGGTEHIGQNPIGQNHRRVSISTTGPSASEELLTYSSELISDWCRTKTHKYISEDQSTCGNN